MKWNRLSGPRVMGAVFFTVVLLALSSGQLAMGAKQKAVTTVATATDTTNATAASARAIVPQLIKFSGTLTDLAGKPISGPVDVTFSLYSQQDGGTPLWYESQTVNANAVGEYTTLLGAMTASGVPMDLFTSGQARWLGVAVRGLPEQSRILLVSVPYAMTSGNAEMLGGKPAADYLLASQSGTSSTTTTTAVIGTSSATGRRAARQTAIANPQSITTGGTANYLAAFVDSSVALGNSNVYQDPTSNDIGIGTTAPQRLLDIEAPASSSVARMGRFTNSAGAWFEFQPAGALSPANPQWASGLSGGSRDYSIWSWDGSNAITRVDVQASGGNVGIGTTAPASKLDVAGDVNVTVVLQGRRGRFPEALLASTPPAARLACMASAAQASRATVGATASMVSELTEFSA